VTTQLEPTGERVIEDAYHRSIGAFVIYTLHAASYRFAEQFCAGRRVIDLGCGSGYGAARIASIAEWVEGVDISAEAVAFARARYEVPNLCFSEIAPDGPLPFPCGSFDVVLSFQVIEHVSNVNFYLREARRVLKPGGVLLVVTPDRQHRLFPWQKPWNRWHLREYSAAQLGGAVAHEFVVEQLLKMGAPWAIAGVEHRRYRWAKWITLPFTLACVPERVRRGGLDMIHNMLRKRKPVVAEAREERADFGFDESAILIGRDPPYSMNLVLVARNPAADQT
jgi:SAM-dependent methyltransferase